MPVGFAGSDRRLLHKCLSAATWAMVGVIWFVQVVHYPLMRHVSAEQFAAFENEHRTRAMCVTLPLMLSELLLAGALWWQRHPPAGRSVLLIGLIWLSTFAIQVPLHTRLSHGFSTNDWWWLVTSNWIRTVLWTYHGVMLLRSDDEPLPQHVDEWPTKEPA